MSEINKLEALRVKLVQRRRSMVASLIEQTKVAFLEDETEKHLTAQTFKRLQDAIDAVDRAIADETRTERRSAA